MAQALEVNGLTIVVDEDRTPGPAECDLREILNRMKRASERLPKHPKYLTAEHCVTALLLLPAEHRTSAVLAKVLKLDEKVLGRKIKPLKKQYGINGNSHFMRVLAGRLEALGLAPGLRQGYQELCCRVGAYLADVDKGPCGRKKSVRYPGRDALVQAIKELAPSAGHRALAAKLGCSQPAISSKNGWLNRTFGCTDLKALRAQLSGASPAVDQQG